jgi:hypothetical protein
MCEQHGNYFLDRKLDIDSPVAVSVYVISPLLIVYRVPEGTDLAATSFGASATMNDARR